MECNVIKDLIPLYVDRCCSEESAVLVREHIEGCTECRAVYESRQTPAAVIEIAAPEKPKRVRIWEASVLQSVLLFISFGLIALGVALEAATPAGSGNGSWALAIVVPATGYMLSLANWYFIRLYHSRKSFAAASLLATAAIILCACVWAYFHYEFTSWLECFTPIGAAMTLLCCVASLLFSVIYAALLGKE